MGCCSECKLIEGHRRRLFTGSGLSREHLSKKAEKQAQNFVCQFCAKAKMTRSSFTEREECKEYKFIEYISSDISVYINCPSREGFRYVLLFTCRGTKYMFPYGLKNKDEKSILACVKDLCENILPRFNKFGVEYKWKHYHTDGAKELQGETIKNYLMAKYGTTITWSSTDTPEQNSISERKFRTLGEMTLAMLLRSGLNKEFWFDAYMTAVYITLRLPTRTHKGWMTPHECCPGGTVPSLGRFRVWGSKAYVLINKGDRRKDWEEKAMTGHFVRYSDTKQGWTVWLPEYQKHVTSVHVLFDEQPPLREKEYFKEMDAATVRENPDAQRLEDFLYLVGTHHNDEGFLYKTTRVIVRKGLIVGYRALITSGRQMVEEQVSIHVADIVLMTNNFEEDSVLTPGWGTNASHVPSREESLHFFGGPRPAVVTESRAAQAENSTAWEMGRSTESRESPQIVSAAVSPQLTAAAAADFVAMDPEPQKVSVAGSNCDPVRNSTASAASKSKGSPRAAVQLDQPGSRQRKRKQRVLANVAKLGEINSLEAATMSEAVAQINMQRDHDEILYEEPQTYQASLDSPQAAEWRGARVREKASLRKRKVMGLHQIPVGAKLIKSKYVYKIKRDKDGKIKQFKARLVILGCQQQKGVDVEQTFAPVVKGVTIRLIMALSFILNLAIHQIDISSAFCYADIEEDVYMKPPAEMNILAGWCFKLYKSLYGLRASPRNWNRHLDKYIKSLNFKPSVLDSCLYYRWHEGKLALILVYVDDILIAHHDLSFICEIKEAFLSTFDMTDMGEMEHFLNIKITRTTKCLRMDQTTYAHKILAKFATYLGGTKKKKKHPFPADAQERLADTTPITEAQQRFVDAFPYRSVVGALLYLSSYTRPDLAYAVGVLARFGSKPTYASCQLAVYVLLYLRGTVDQGIQFSGSEFDLHAFSDADWGGDIMTRRSTTGYVVFAGGGPIAWQSKLQTTVATSSMESEYMALYAGMQELVWLRGVMKELRMPITEPTPFCIDSQSAQDLALNPVFHKRSKHIAIKYHWVRQHVVGGKFGTARLIHVCTGDMSADIFTKALSGPVFIKHRETLSGSKRSRSSVVESRQPKKVLRKR
jgi:hypothetical protein